MAKPDMLLWLNDSRGVYIPRDFAKSFAERDKHVQGVDAEQWAILEQGPESCSNESYWDVWTEVLDSATVTDNNGVKFTLHQDGDLWLIPEGMEWNDDTESFDYPEDRATEG